MSKTSLVRINKLDTEQDPGNKEKFFLKLYFEYSLVDALVSYSDIELELTDVTPIIKFLKIQKLADIKNKIVYLDIDKEKGFVQIYEPFAYVSPISGLEKLKLNLRKEPVMKSFTQIAQEQKESTGED